MRLFTYRRELTEAGLDRVMHAGSDDLVLVVTVGDGAAETVVASGRSVRTSATRSEVAFMVSKDYQGKGIAGRLLQRFVESARANGLSHLEADVLGENRAMLAVFERSGLAMRRRRDGNVVHVTLAL